MNKKKEGFVDADEGEDGVGFKWSFDPLKRFVPRRNAKAPQPPQTSPGICNVSSPPPPPPPPVPLPVLSSVAMSHRRSYLEERGTPWSTVWDQMRAIVAKTIIAVEPKINTLVKMVVPHRNVCFEIYGFDIMLDANMKASLIEVSSA